MPSNTDRYVVPAVLRALQILDSFSFQKPTYTNAELSRKLSLNKSTVTRLLCSLEKAGFIERNDKTAEFRLTYKTYKIGRVYIKQVSLHTEAMPLLKDLTARFNETSHLGILDEFEVFFMDWVESTQSVTLPSLAGNRLPAYCTALGKVLIAYLDGPALERYLNQVDLKPYTSHTITARNELRRHLRQIKNQEYAFDDGEFQSEVRSVASPLRNEFDQVIAGISIAGPVYRLKDDAVLKKLISEVKKTARMISKRLGCNR